MAAGKERLGSYEPRMIFAGDFPVIKDEGTAGETIKGLAPVVLGTDGKIMAATKATAAEVYGLAAEDAAADSPIVIYLTGQFFGEAIETPTGTTAADFKAPLRKVGIYLVKTENAAAGQPTA